VKKEPTASVTSPAAHLQGSSEASALVVPRPRTAADTDAGDRGSRRASVGREVRATVFPLIQRAAPTALRLSLAAVYVWFGLLKLLGDSPVEALVSSTLPFGNPGTTVRILGAVEVALGVGLLLGKARRLLLIAVIAHLCGTFLTVLMAPKLLFQHQNPLLLTADGEFVLKNLVLITAALLLITATRTNTPSR